MEEGEVDVDPGDEVEEVGEGLDGAELGAAAAGADDGDVYLISHCWLFFLRSWEVLRGIVAGWVGCWS